MSHERSGSAYARLRELIVEGELEPGEPLREHALAQALGVSRTPIREAFRRLESDGLVASSGRGVVVAALDPPSLRDAYEVRAALDALAAELAARRQRAGRIAPAELAELDRYADDAEHATAARDLDAAVAHNRLFHLEIARLSGNEIALDALEAIWDRISVSTHTYLDVTDNPGEITADHREIARAISAGEPSRAASAARAHVLRTLTTKRASARSGQTVSVTHPLG